MTSNSSINIDKQIQWLEGGIAEGYINYYDYNEFKNFQHIGSGGFSKVYRASWKNSDTVVALKYFKNNRFIIKEIVNEIKLLQKVNLHVNIIQFFGITKRKNNDDTNYLLVLEYADSSTLGNFLKDNFNRLDWNMKLQFAIQIADAVSCLHQNDIIHCDLHSDNILVHQNMLKLADFGLSHRLAEISTQKNVFGVLPYIDPQHFQIQTNNNKSHHYKPNKKSDVYSIGVILWEISSGHKPFESYDKFYLRQKLLLEILNGKRETPIPNTPIDYINIYTKCWEINPDDRPNMQQVLSLLKLIDLNEIIINEIVLQYEDSIQKGIDKEDIIQLIKIHLIIKNINENEIFNYLLVKNNELKNIQTLAIFYYYGIGTEKNEVRAFELYKEAAEKGHIDAIHQLGECYYYGIGTEKNEARTFELYKEAVEKGHINAMYQLGKCYYHGIGIENNRIMAYSLYEKAAEKGHINAMYQLGECYYYGIGTEKNNARAFELYKNAAKKGHINAMYQLGEFYYYGIETEKNNARAFELYKKAAEKENIAAIYNLGYCYQNGIGTVKNGIKAFELYKEAAEKGHINAMYQLVAEKENINAMYQLGECYYYGIGTEKDRIMASKLYKAAAKKGHISAKTRIEAYELLYKEDISKQIETCIWLYFEVRPGPDLKTVYHVPAWPGLG
ncbi:kinase-like domain-containing protein [Rhizophagus clarus]|uniref:Kinase-like domain-containing protein n=1 Tax=Rhizophagus clarus TaxID=94130 RepID=A0A8H3QZP3_9GLOM|nr:kinase-like domain-containing protein [Rhizophagus clarus]